jgi:hypothetical protein
MTSPLRLLFAGSLACAPLLTPAPAAADALPLDPTLLLSLHNAQREAVGVPPLKWSERLAEGAQHWAETLASLNQMQHSHTSGVGENLAVWWGHHVSYDDLIGMWVKEKDAFQPGLFPAVSTTGDWQTVAHYTQMIWRDTTEVGCGIAYNGRTDFLVCWYGPEGNYFGRAVY